MSDFCMSDFCMSDLTMSDFTMGDLIQLIPAHPQDYLDSDLS